MKRRILSLCILAVATAGCGRVQSIVEPLTTPRSEQQQAQQTQGGPITLSGGTPTLSPTPIEQPAPRATNWRRDLPRNQPLFNLSNDAVTIYSEADQSSQTGQLLPGEGGFIETCDDEKPVCRMNFGNGRTGWVAMSNMARSS